VNNNRFPTTFDEIQEDIAGLVSKSSYEYIRYVTIVPLIVDDRGSGVEIKLSIFWRSRPADEVLIRFA
jgi:hypothetical protein